jgi:hypothetical protein
MAPKSARTLRTMGIEEAVVSVLVVGMVIGLPMLGLTLRFALKPLIEAWVRVREVRPAPAGELEGLKLRVAALEAVWEQRLGAGTLQPGRPMRELPKLD